MTDSNYVAPEALMRAHSHPRDCFIGFDEEHHIYSITGMASSPLSVTTVIKRNFAPFDADEAIAAMMSSPKWESNPLFGSTPAEIKAAWKDTARMGTDLHRAIEIYYNELADPETVYPSAPWLEAVRASPEYGYFLEFAAFFKKTYPDFAPHRTEWVIYDETRGLAGTIDMTFIDKDGKIMIVDWKRSKNVTDQAFRGKRGTGPFKDWPDANFFHYSGQLNLYRSILESQYGVKVVSMHLVVCHPNQDTFRFLQVGPVDMSKIRA